VVKVGVALRLADQTILQRLSLERFILARGGDPEEMFRAVFGRGDRPSVSSAIRVLIDGERERRAREVLKTWKKMHSKKPAPSAEELLRDDFVFGIGGPTEAGEVLANLEPHEVVDGTLKRRRR